MKRAWMGILPVLLALVAWRTYHKAGELDARLSLPQVHGAGKTALDEYSALANEFDKKDTQAAIAIQAMPAEKDRATALRNRSAPADYARRFLELAQKSGQAPEAVEALAWLIGHCPSCPEGQKAFELLLRDHIESDRIGPVCEQLALLHSEQAETSLREIARHNPHPDVQAQAQFGLARSLKDRADMLALRHATDQAALAQQADERLELVIEKYKDQTAGQESMAEAARRELFELRNLSIGKVAPEIEGKDTDGQTMRLSDYRGRVVVIEFWGNWCIICRKQYSYERSLVQRMQRRPAVLLGVNSDGDPAVARETMESEKLHIRSWSDGGTVRGGAIARKWNVQALPATFVLDQRGVVRYKLGPRLDGHDASDYILDPTGAVRNKWDLRAEQIRAAVDMLLEEMQSRPGH